MEQTDGMTEDMTIEGVHFHEGDLDGEYDSCVFVSCDFSSVPFLRTGFNKCEFRRCNFSLNTFQGVLTDVSFVESKMTGTDFTGIASFSSGLVFDHSNLDFAGFASTRLRKTVFRECRLYEAYFTDADIAHSLFDRCDLERASFAGANLEYVDFSTSFHYSINPNSCRLNKTIFSEHGLRGLLDELNIIIKP